MDYNSHFNAAYITVVYFKHFIIQKKEILSILEWLTKPDLTKTFLHNTQEEPNLLKYLLLDFSITFYLIYSLQLHQTVNEDCLARC